MMPSHDIPESDVNSHDQVPLLNDEENGVSRNHRYLSPKSSVLGVVGLLCIFTFVMSTALFGVLYYKMILNNRTRLPKWPPPSKSLLGEYSTAAVAADNELCSDIGRDILLQGGNAVDAAIATLFCIGVMDTQSAGLGGGHFMTIYNATTKKCHVVDAREKAPLAATENMYKDRWNASKYGWLAVAVPGEVHGLWTEYKTFGGKVPWATLVNPTIGLMEEGYPTSHALAFSLKNFQTEIMKEKTMRDHFINPKTGNIYKVGEQIKTRKNFVKLLKVLAESNDPVEAFYRGKLTEQMVDEFGKYGGLLTLEDFAQYEAKIRHDSEVIYTRLSNGRIVCGPPPPSGSAVSQAILNILDRIPFNMSTFDGNVDLFHNFIEASKFAYAERSSLGDIDFVHNASEIAKNITSPEWAANVRSEITPLTHPDAYYGGDFRAAPEDHGTTHISVVDRYGNAVSVTSTINLILGALVMSESTGILWNDQMDDFSSPGHPNYFGFPPSPANYIRPGKRPMSSMAPLVIYNVKNDKELLAIGAAGGSKIISGVAGTALHTLWLNHDVKRAIDWPRLHNQLKPNVTEYEPNWPKVYIKALSERGHILQKSNTTMTVVTAVQKNFDGTVYANSDYRKGSESEPSGY
ncbi:gamma-glutamyltranspeptidase domain-containing protein [Ditylenchus destructor]|uniref:Gamma-glutamyltranspeptidase domain-containing protein n=1 Tax=Ditylenchus destructor TaxID=166010 RepID=A0AAD4NJK5_9BILA|nr:gamma-glutamyltranspeptidase domain-containing protein [Ditylenchus destructor]